MCRFLSLDFECTLRCPIDKSDHKVRFQAWPSLRGHALDVVDCDAAPDVEHLTCAKNCRALLESGHYWQTMYPDSVQYAESQ